MNYLISKSSLGAQYIKYLEQFKCWKTEYFDKWHEILIKQAETTVFKNQFVKVLNADLSVTISYLDTIFTDLLADWENIQRVALEEGKRLRINFLNNSHIFSLLILTRSILLNTAYLNVYDELEDELNKIDYDIFDNLPPSNSNVLKTEVKTLIDLFCKYVKIFDFGNGDKIRIIQQVEGSVKKLFITKQIIQPKKEKVTDLSIIKNLEYTFNKEFPGFFKQNEIGTLYDLTSKTFHRHELLLGYLNHLINDPRYLADFIANTIQRIVRICLISFGYQVKIFLAWIDVDSSVIDKDIKRLIQE